MRETVIFYLNGKKCELNATEASLMLSDFLRYEKSLTGTKVVCAEGDCGACTVLKSQTFEGKKKFLPVNSCIQLTAQLDGESLVTVEGLKNHNELSCVQDNLVKCHGSQCGFCTPGFAMAISGLVEKKIEDGSFQIERQEIKNSLTGNLCRCTGYEAIINSVETLDLSKIESLQDKYLEDKIQKDLKNSTESSLYLKNNEFEFFSPRSINEALDYLSKNSDVSILGSGTDLGVIHNKRKIKLNKVLSLKKIDELSKIKNDGLEITLGSSVTLEQLRNYVKNIIPEFSDYLNVFASPQIKNSATVIGNIATASPIGDTPPVFLALNAKLIIGSFKGMKEVALSDFFLSYRKINLSHDELILGLRFKIPSKETYLRFFKISNRKDLDISSVNMSFALQREAEDKKKIKNILISAGGIAAIPLRFKKTEEFLKDKEVNSQNVKMALDILHSEYTPLSDLRASAGYRRVIVEKTFLRFFSDLGESL